MAFAQLTYRESLRDIEACLRSLSAKLYHMGFRCPVARSIRRQRIARLEDLPIRIRIARPLYARDSRSNPLRSGLDHHRPGSSAGRGAAGPPPHVYPHYRLNISTRSAPSPAPSIMDTSISNAFRVHPLLVVLRRANQEEHLAPTALLASRHRSTGVRSDQTVILGAIESAQAYPDPLRRVSFRHRDEQAAAVPDFVLALTIGIYRSRWQAVLKQHLRIKVREDPDPPSRLRARIVLGLEASHQILQILSVTLTGLAAVRLRKLRC